MRLSERKREAIVTAHADHERYVELLEIDLVSELAVKLRLTEDTVLRVWEES